MSFPCFCCRGLSYRRVHSLVATLVVIPFLVTITTGFSYRFARNVLHYEKPSVSWLLNVHTASVIQLGTVYPVCLSLTILLLMVSGLPLHPVINSLWRRIRGDKQSSSSPNNQSMFTWPKQWSSRTIHRTSVLLVLLPLLLTAVTGGLWAWLRYWTYTKEELAWLMTIHQGSYIDPVFYTSALFLLTLIPICSGIPLLPVLSVCQRNSARTESGVKYAMLNVQRAFENPDDDFDDFNADDSDGSSLGENVEQHSDNEEEEEEQHRNPNS